jgi:hypothetical protein
MAPTSISSGTLSEQDPNKIPTASEVAAMGGIWTPSSTKKDKLAEYRLELKAGQTSLDDAATSQQKLDLFLADGLLEVFKAAEIKNSDVDGLEDFIVWLNLEGENLPQDLSQAQFESFLSLVISQVETKLDEISKDQYLQNIRDFMQAPVDDTGFQKLLVSSDQGNTIKTFHSCVRRFRLHLIKAAAERLKSNWTKLVTLTAGDTDRAAVKGELAESNASTLSRDALRQVLIEFAVGDCSSRFDALWKLVDKDNDGLLDAPEMTDVAYHAVSPISAAIQTFTNEAVDARPVRLSLEMEETLKLKQGFWNRRKESSQAKRLKKFMTSAIKYHFENDLEMPQRLRVIYAWANKSHQGNKIDNVHIDTGLGGRKRYVELSPKISLPEFREVQLEHFPHLNRVSEEILMSFRDNLLVQQGQGRQRTELYWNSTYFMIVVCIIDAGIYVF